ncbi:d-3-phosphoglycerate dehydrogenase, putative [Perkinsus marinus ATCC 50983]|uniref:D-3-phosphoglycerate dehydrogenase, putative n=1 Tax=Perkinsus marinus (strain ATCC 50983 / TXsc) TaxID=423536 RepID=C5KH45_PERM5|nr:d-3-phosphoglycerate dehydrogenase, putative [Perkinsus marinus ATCC 50983]EER15907.1 d-3-phosphoglycerate dehydrogenase, putative [Perkinsus marinus ATCC 50983]|eukprot:XP_002784111.1 d-3-phosphoglycerate dehydrogenase, putative [Perkinsus marinus ATCC 50983]
MENLHYPSDDIERTMGSAHVRYKSTDELYAALPGCIGCIVRSDKVNTDFFDHASDLQVVVRAGAGYDNIDLNEATKRGICVMNTPGQNAHAVAELVFGLLLYHARRRFSGSSGFELKDCSGIPHDGCIDREKLSALKEGAILVNTARQEVIDEDALLDVLTARPDLTYIADIKPSNLDQIQGALGETRFTQQVVVTPVKMGAQTLEANINAAVAGVQEIARLLFEGDTTYQVNKTF